MNSLALHGLLSDEGSDSEFVIEAAANQDNIVDKAIADFEASSREEDDEDSQNNTEQLSRLPTPSTPGAISDNDKMPLLEEMPLLESIQVLKTEKKIAPTISEKKPGPRMRRYFDSADSLLCFNCGERGHASQTCSEDNVKPCYLCGHPGHFERVCPNQLCFRCHTGGHMAKDCQFSGKTPLIRVCSRCGSLRHTLLNCTYQVRQDSVELASVRCFICGKYGHLCCRNSRKLSNMPQFCSNCASKGHWHFDCPHQGRMTSYYDSLKSKPNNDTARGSVCFTCSKRGHWSRDCPNNRSQVENTSSSESEWCFVCQVVGHRAGECPSSGLKAFPQTKKRQRETGVVAAKEDAEKPQNRKPARNRTPVAESKKVKDVETRKKKRQKPSHKRESRKFGSGKQPSSSQGVLRDGRWVS